MAKCVINGLRQMLNKVGLKGHPYLTPFLRKIALLMWSLMILWYNNIFNEVFVKIETLEISHDHLMCEWTESIWEVET